MKTCQNCGAEMEQDALFCRECGTRFLENHLECGTALTEHSVNQSGKPLSYIDKILDNHKKCVKNNVGKNIETTFGFQIIGKAMFEIKLTTNAENRNKLALSFKDSKRAEKQAFERFKKHELFVLFTAELSQMDGYSGYIELGNFDNVVNVVSKIALDVFNYKEGDSRCRVFYVKQIEGQHYEMYVMKDGSFVREKGCLGIIIAVIALGATLMSL